MWSLTQHRDVATHAGRRLRHDQQQADELAFTEPLENIYERHTHVVPTLAQGVVAMKAELGTSGDSVLNECPFLQDFLNRFHNVRHTQLCVN